MRALNSTHTRNPNREIITIIITTETTNCRILTAILNAVDTAKYINDNPITVPPMIQNLSKGA